MRNVNLRNCFGLIKWPEIFSILSACLFQTHAVNYYLLFLSMYDEVVLTMASRQADDIQDLGIYSLQPNGEVNPIASILITVLAEMDNIERTNIQYRFNSGRAQYARNGGKLGRKTETIKSEDKKREEYKEVITLLKRGYSIRNTTISTGSSISTVQRIKNQFVK